MAANNNGAGGKKKIQTIDPIYQKFTKSVIRALGSSEFYGYFMDAVSKADNQIQFSNRRLEKTVDIKWVGAVESSLQAFQTIINNPRRVIQEEELIVNVANAKRGGSDVVQHLAQHASLVEKFDEKTNEVRPGRVMQKFREDAYGQYENRLVFTALDMAYTFVKIRHDALLSAMSDEFGAKLKVQTNMESDGEAVHMDMFLHINQTDAPLETDSKNADEFSRISRIYRVLSMYMNTAFAQEMAKAPKVKGSIVKTNVLKKNPSYHRVMQLFEYLRNYQEVGYSIRVIEQNPQISESFQRDIFHNILFNYLVLKGYLEKEEDRTPPKPLKEKQRSLKPKFIKQIIEELTEDYDLPDVEIRKVLIEELTKEQLMHEEAEERRRLVEEQQKRKQEEEERLRKEKEAEKERLRREKEAERERLRQEKAAEEERLQNERMRREQEDNRRSGLLRKELDFFAQNLDRQKQLREKQLARQAAKEQDFADAARLLEQAEERRREEKIRKKLRLQDQKEQQLRQQQLALEQAQREEQARQEAERRRQEEQQRLEEQRLLDAANRAAEPYKAELQEFMQTLPRQQVIRQKALLLQREQAQQRETEARKRRELRAGAVQR